MTQPKDCSSCERFSTRPLKDGIHGASYNCRRFKITVRKSDTPAVNCPDVGPDEYAQEGLC